MEKQKICIIGGSLTGLVTAISLSQLHCDIDLVIHNFKENLKSDKTVAISENNFNFFNKLEVSKSLKQEMWPCSIMKLYTSIENQKFRELFDLNRNKKKEKVLYMFKNSKILKLMIKKIEKTKNIYVKNYKKVSSIYDKGLLKCVKFSDNKTSKYNLVIICTGNNSDIVKTIFKNHLIKNSYEEFAITTILSHASLKNNTSRQIFLDDEIFALLPISNNQTSIVWTIKKDKKNKNAIFFKKKIKTYAEKYLKKVKFKTKVEYNNLNFLIRNKYYTDRTLLFGDALHVMHPFIGQSFNMTLRDLVLLKKVLKKKIDLGLDIGSADILSEFSDEAKPRNFAFALGSDVIKNFLPLKDVRNNTLKILNKSSFAKDIFFNIANKGFRF